MEAVTQHPTEISVMINGAVNFVPISFWKNFTRKMIVQMDQDAKEDHRIWYKYPDHPQFDQEWHELVGDAHLDIFNGMKIVTGKDLDNVKKFTK